MRTLDIDVVCVVNPSVSHLRINVLELYEDADLSGAVAWLGNRDLAANQPRWIIHDRHPLAASQLPSPARR